MSTNTKKSPFLKLLEPENLSRIKIDNELIPAFRTVILKINDYFLENDLMDAKDWDSFFEEYLLSHNKLQHYIKNESTPFRGQLVCGNYNFKDKIIRVLTYNKSFEEICHFLCHEFIHFLVSADIKQFNNILSDCLAINEGMTEELTNRIMKDYLLSIYEEERELANLYCSLAGNRDPFKCFLNNSLYFTCDTNTITSIKQNATRFIKYFPNNEISVHWHKIHKLNLQRLIIDNALEEYTITSFEEYIKIINQINSISLYLENNDYQECLEKIINRYLDNLNLAVEEEQGFKAKLLNLAKISKKAQIYGNKEVAEYLIDDVYIAFDKNGYDFSEKKRRWTTEYSAYAKLITVTYKGKTYKINTDSMEYTNWQSVYNSYLGQIQKLLFDAKKRQHTEHTNEEKNTIQHQEMQVNEEDFDRLSSFEEERKQKIEIYIDPDGRKFISTKDAISLGFNNPRDVSYLPTEKINHVVGYKLITEEEYETIRKEYIIINEHVGKLNVLSYNGNYYVDWLTLQNRDDSHVESKFYKFDNSIFNEEPLSKLEFERIKKYYSINYIDEKDLRKNNDDENEPSVDEEYEIEKQKIMKARFPEETKKQLLEELEKEHSGNNFHNTSGRAAKK